MINFDVFDNARKKYIDEDMPFLVEARKTMLNSNRYKGLKILQNIPLTVEAVLKIEPLVLGGADVTVSCISFLDPSLEAIEILQQAEVKVKIHHAFSDDFDFCLDCSGEMKDLLHPKYGTVELTQTGSEIYRNAQLTYPVISVDDSMLKNLETFFGTGAGFVRALMEFSHEEISDKPMVVFGYGKVGKGIVHELLKYTDRITVIEKRAAAKKAALKKGIKVVDAKEIDTIKKIIHSAFCVVTATGVRGVISNFYGLHKLDFHDALLTNMGAEDEYGINFHEKDVAFGKKPFNFSIEEPTPMKYLDPILYAHNLGIDLILEGKVKLGYNAYPMSVAVKILKKWVQLHRESVLDLDEYLA